jgi:hypothetical protein
VVLNDGTGQGASRQDAAQSQDGQRNKYCTTHKLNLHACPPVSLFRGLNECSVQQGPSGDGSICYIFEQVLPHLLSPQETEVEDLTMQMVAVLQAPWTWMV